MHIQRLHQWQLMDLTKFLAPLFHPGEDASLPISSGGSYQTLVNNVFYFTQRVVDKLWQGMFNKESKLVVDFIVQLIGQVCSGEDWAENHQFPLVLSSEEQTVNSNSYQYSHISK